YALTARAEQLFAHHYDRLTNDVLSVLATTAGDEQRDRVCEGVADRMAARHLLQLNGRPLGERVAETVRILAETGVIADCESTTAGFIIREYNCPYFDVAQEHRCICRLDRRYLANLTGVPVQQLTHLLDGGNCCAFLVAE